MPKVFFCADNVLVSSSVISVGLSEFPLTDLQGVRSRRVRALFGDSYEVILAHRLLREVMLLRHRNAYFVFQLVKAIEAALEELPAESSEQQALWA